MYAAGHYIQHCKENNGKSPGSTVLLSFYSTFLELLKYPDPGDRE